MATVPQKCPVALGNGLNSHKCLGSDSGNLRKWVYQIRYPPPLPQLLGALVLTQENARDQLRGNTK